MESRRKRSRSQILKWCCYVLGLFVCAALQTTPGLFQLGQAKPLLLLPLCLAVSVCEGEFAGALFGMVCGLLWDYTAGRTVGMLALEMMLLCFAVGVLVQLYLQSAPGNFAVISAAAALLVLSCDWLFFYRMPGYSGSAQRYLWFVLPSAALTIRRGLTAGGTTDEPKRTQDRHAAHGAADRCGGTGHGPVRPAADLSAAGQ